MTRPALPDRLAMVGTMVMTAGGGVTILGTLRPWVASGRRPRNSYDIVQLVERLGFAPDGPLHLAMRGWPLVPLLVVAAVVAAWWRRCLLAAAIGLIAGLYAGGTALAVSTGPREGVVRVLGGPRVTATGAALLVIAAGWLVMVAVADRLRRRATNAETPDVATPAGETPTT